jgi:hypothetical protein
MVRVRTCGKTELSARSLIALICGSVGVSVVTGGSGSGCSSHPGIIPSSGGC